MVTIVEYTFIFLCGMITYGILDALWMILDDKCYVKNEPIRVYMTNGEKTYNEEFFPRTIDEIGVVVPKDNDKEEIE